MIDLGAHETVETSAGRVLDVIAYRGREDQVAMRGDAVLAARLANAAPRLRTAIANGALATAATYVVTGGFGGIGLSAARWLRRRAPGI